MMKHYYINNVIFIILKSRCGVFYGPALVENQWVEIDCGYRKGILGRLAD